MTPEDRLNIVFLGCGAIAAAHSRTLARMGEPVRRFYASRSDERAASFERLFRGAGSYGSYDAALADGRIDVAFVTTPPASHLELTLRALRGGKDVIVEKPAFLRAADFDAVAAVERETDRRVLVAENYGYKPLARVLREVLAAGEIGDVRFVHLNAVKHQAQRGWRDDAAASGGGALFEGGVHWVDLVANLGLPVRGAQVFRAGDGALERSSVMVLSLRGRRRGHAPPLVGDRVAPPRPPALAHLRHRRVHRVRVERPVRRRLRTEETRPVPRPPRHRRPSRDVPRLLRGAAHRPRAADDARPRAAGHGAGGVRVRGPGEAIVNAAIALAVGLLSGAHTSTWGMYKDSPHEGFTWRKYFRSIVLSAAIALVWEAILGFDLARAWARVVLFGLTYVTERGLVELYKTFLREEDQSKYFIPMQFHVMGRVVESRRVRWAAAAACVAAVLLVAWGLHSFQRAGASLSGWMAVLLIGSIGGWLSALGGAFKDAPVEGFETLKFFRSPLVALSWAAVVACFSRDYLHIALCGLGYTVATIETYKTFFFPNRPRGKFAGKPILFPRFVTWRYRFAPLYAAIWVAVLANLAVAFSEPRPGLLGAGARSEKVAALGPAVSLRALEASPAPRAAGHRRSRGRR